MEINILKKYFDIELIEGFDAFFVISYQKRKFFGKSDEKSREISNLFSLVQF